MPWVVQVGRRWVQNWAILLDFWKRNECIALSCWEWVSTPAIVKRKQTLQKWQNIFWKFLGYRINKIPTFAKIMINVKNHKKWLSEFSCQITNILIFGTEIQKILHCFAGNVENETFQWISNIVIFQVFEFWRQKWLFQSLANIHWKSLIFNVTSKTM